MTQGVFTCFEKQTTGVCFSFKARSTSLPLTLSLAGVFLVNGLDTRQCLKFWHIYASCIWSCARVYHTLKSRIEPLISHLQLHNLPVNCARELSKPWKDSVSPLVCTEKKLGFGLFVGDIISGVGFGHFGSGYLALGPTTRWKYFAQVFIEH